MPKTIEFSVGEHKYTARRPPAMQLFHVQRRIAPLLPPLLPIYMKLRSAEGGIAESLLSSPELLQPIADGIASLPNELVDYVFNTCLAVVQREHEGKWMPIWSESQKCILFDDIDDPGYLLPIVVNVIRGFIGPFISGLLTSQQATSEPSEPA